MHKILVVDDERKARVYISDLVKSVLPHSIITQTDNPLTALELIKKNTYDMLFVDILMPQMNGLDMIREIRTGNKTLFIVLVSSSAQFEYAQQGMKLGTSDYIVKPLTGESVAETIQRYLETKEQTEKKELVLFGKGNENYVANPDDVIAIERVDRFRVRIYKEYELIQNIRGTLSEAIMQFPACFVPLNRTFIVNYTKIKRWDAEVQKVFFLHKGREHSAVCSRKNMKQLLALFKKLKR